MLKNLLVGIAVLLLVACGSSDNASSDLTFPLQQMNLDALVAVTRSYLISGTFSGSVASGNGISVETALQSSTFEGSNAQEQTITNTMNLSVGGVLQNIPVSTMQAWYDANGNPIGTSGSEFEVMDQPITSLPVSAHVNDAGTWVTSKRYTADPNQGGTLLGSTTVTYQLQPDSETTALLVLLSVKTDTSGATTETDTRTLRITTSGTQTVLSDLQEMPGSYSLLLTYQ
jgi:hypothetical protein